MNDTNFITSVTPLTLPALGFPEAEGDADLALPSDHPRWQRDVLSVSTRARAVLATVAPIVIRVLTYWDHRLREIVFGNRRLGVDPAGCYRLR